MTQKTIGNPLSWITGRLFQAGGHAAAIADHVGGVDTHAAPQVNAITIADLRAALRAGFDDFHNLRSDVLFLCLIYPVVGVLLVWLTFDQDLLPLLAPVVSGFALVGPIAGVGMYELSRRREVGEDARWYHALAVLQSPAFGAMLVLSMILLLVFVVWLGAAALIYNLTMGPQPPASLSSFVGEMLTTSAGWTMMIVGTAVGFCFALGVLVASIISFPLMLDRNVGLVHSVEASINLARKSPVTVLVWGAIVAAALVIGSIPALLGLIFVMPILGHATWHLYRRAVS